jgi:ATP-grasp domain
LLHRWKESIPRITSQRFIGGVPASSAVLCWNGEVVAGISVEAIKTIHATGPATVVRILDNAEIVEVTRHVVERLGLSGFVGFDFILDETSGRPFLIEMNPRPTPISHLSLGIETDLVGALLMKLTATKPTKPQMESVPGKIIALFPGEFWRDPKSDYLLSCHHDAPWDQPELIDEYTRPSSPHTLSWISRLIYQMFESLPWASHEHRA